MTATSAPIPDSATAGGGLAAILERAQRLHPRVIDLSLERIERLLARLGNPERALPPVIHIAGTNGKGSVLAILRAVCEAAGYAVHRYTSPHLVRFNERITVAGHDIADAPLAALLLECEVANGAAPITFFEFTTAAAFLAFARTPADILLLETGLGGRLDATNLVEYPRVTAISPIGIDHQQFLGETLAEIAGEKAGILKPGVPAVISAQAEEALTPILARANAVDAPLYREGVDWRAAASGDGMVFEGRCGNLTLPRPALPGAHQIANAGLALACLDALEGFTIGEDAIRAGLRDVVWPARLQRLKHGPLVKALPAGWDMWLDGGHNADAGQALALWAAENNGRPLHLIVAMLDTKDPSTFLTPFARRVASVRAVGAPGEHAFIPAAELAARAAALGLCATPAASVAAALNDIVAGATALGRVLICGSLYMAGDVLAENG